MEVSVCCFVDSITVSVTTSDVVRTIPLNKCVVVLLERNTSELGNNHRLKSSRFVTICVHTTDAPGRAKGDVEDVWRCRVYVINLNLNRCTCSSWVTRWSTTTRVLNNVPESCCGWNLTNEVRTIESRCISTSYTFNQYGSSDRESVWGSGCDFCCCGENVGRNEISNNRTNGDRT